MEERLHMLTQQSIDAMNAEAIKQGKYAPVPNTVVVQDLKALGSVRDLMQPNE